MQEIWLPIPGYESAYAVSNMGRVKTLARTANRRMKNGTESTRQVPEKILSLTTDKHGTLRANISVNGEKTVLDVHRVVAHLFVPNSENFGYVDFHDGDKSNVAASNLKWTNLIEHHGFLRKKKVRTKRGGHKLTQSDVLEIRDLAKSGMMQNDIAEKFAVTQGMVSRTIARKVWGRVA